MLVTSVGRASSLITSDFIFPFSSFVLLSAIDLSDLFFSNCSSLFETSTIFASFCSSSVLASLLLTSITTPSGNLTPFTIPVLSISTLTHSSESTSEFFIEDLSFEIASVSMLFFCILFLLKLEEYSLLYSFFVNSLRACTLADNAANRFILLVSLSRISFTISETSFKDFPLILSNKASLIFTISGARSILTPIYISIILALYLQITNQNINFKKLCKV